MQRVTWGFFLFITVLSLSLVHAQSLAEAAKKEKERRAKMSKSTRKVRVLTQKDLEKLRKPENKLPLVVMPRGARKTTKATRPGKSSGTETGKATPEGRNAASIENEILRLRRERKKKEEELKKTQAELRDLQRMVNSTNAIYMSTQYGQLMRKKRLLEEKIAKLREELRQIDEQLQKLNEALGSVG